MYLFKKIEDLRQYVSSQKQEGKTVGLVPTMGALHDGHITLIKASIQSADITVCSIFVNPTQFNDINDFNKYPITVDKDVVLLEENGCDVLFLPSVQEMYPHGTALQQKYELGPIEHRLEGSYRPRHFQGVCQVVHRLLDIVQPDILLMGQKDYQQIKVIQKMISLLHLHVRLQMVGIVRAANGLALSSRNARLSDREKEAALILSRALQKIKEKIRPNVSVAILQEEAEKSIIRAGFEKVDYVSIADGDTLEPVDIWDGKKRLVALVAAWIDGVRLIDNTILSE